MPFNALRSRKDLLDLLWPAWLWIKRRLGALFTDLGSIPATFKYFYLFHLSKKWQKKK